MCEQDGSGPTNWGLSRQNLKIRRSQSMNPPIPCLEASGEDGSGCGKGGATSGTEARVSTGGGGSLVGSSAISTPDCDCCAPINPSFKSSSETAFCCPEQYSQSDTPAGFTCPQAVHSENELSLICEYPQPYAYRTTAQEASSYGFFHQAACPIGCVLERLSVKYPSKPSNC